MATWNGSFSQNNNENDQENSQSISSSVISKSNSNHDSESKAKSIENESKSNINTKEVYYNRATDNYGERAEIAQDSSAAQNNVFILSSTDALDWKCRECGYINEDSETICDTCGTEKPIHPCLETHQSYSERRRSVSSSDGRSSSPEQELMYNRSGSISPISFQRRDSSSDESSSTIDMSNSENHGNHSSFQSRKSRQKSSYSFSSDDSQDPVPMDTTNAEDLSKKQVSSSNEEESYEQYTKIDDKVHLKTRIVSAQPDYTSNNTSYKDEHSLYNSTTNKPSISLMAPIKNTIDSDRDHLSSSTYTDEDYLTTSRTSQSINHSIVYVPDLPVNIDNSKVLEDMIRDCLKLRHKQSVLDIKCNTLLGIGIIYLSTEVDKKYLIDGIRITMLESSSSTTISFVDELDLISYVVIPNDEKKDLPTADEVQRRWRELYKSQLPLECQQLSVLFPNIFRITTHSLNELLEAMSRRTFSINNHLATIYFRADCCFYEDLPRTTNQQRFIEAIRQQITDKYMSPDSMYIQYNKDDANAVILTSGRARIWSLRDSIQLDGRKFNKKDSLACRLLIRNIPKTELISSIRDHEIFGQCVVNSIAKNDHVILELSNRSIFEKCVKQGAFLLGTHPLRIEVYTSASNPEDSEIDAETWYETEMRDYTKANIMQFMSDPQHPIFRYKWNARAFLEQFRRWTSKEHDRSIEKDPVKYEKLCNLRRHLLRMTVMLNTIGVIKKGSYRIDDKEIKLKFDRLKTILYDHKSKLQHGKTVPLSQATTFPFTSTSVKVVHEDCLIVYKKLVKEGFRPVLLNMANATNPGGGYRQGDGAQEETLFRRSNYYQSLDCELDDGKPSARFHCNSNGDLQPLTQRDRLYPMDEYGAIYTSGLTVFRLPEESGYIYMEIPMYDVCSIAMAAYRDPKVENSVLTGKFSIGTRKKIENIFAIAHQHKHDCLVLSAFGCGAFRNPPTHIATIFKSVIEQYAGYFKCIYFAIIDDHNAGRDFNPKGNYLPFHSVFNGYQIEPKTYRMIDMMIGPWRILKQSKNDQEVTLSDIKILHLTPCYYGGKCKDLQNEQHCREFLHPPLCSSTGKQTSCKEKHDDQHMLWYRHRQQCLHGGECKSIEDDSVHGSEFEHPDFCRDRGACENLDPEHLKSYRHVPFCRHRRQCIDYLSKPNEHCQRFRHCIPMCRFAAFCTRFHDREHHLEENHPYIQPCPFTPFHCHDYNVLSASSNIKSLPIHVQNHCLQFSHMCRYGRQCHDKSSQHLRTTIHIARHLCSYGDRCTKLDQEDHLNSFSHTGLPDIRRLCHHQDYECRDKRNPEHIKEYRHDGNYDNSGVISYFGQNRRIDFVENQDHMIKAINGYVSQVKQKLSISKEIQNFVKALQPVHRCSKLIFESILVHGHVMSSEHMEHLKKPRFAAQAVQEHKHVRAIFDRYKLATIEQHAKEYIRAIVALEYNKKYTAHPVIDISMSVSGTSFSSDEMNDTIRREERILNSMLKPEEIDTIRKRAIDIATASWNLCTAPTGIQYELDKKLGTNKHVFSILGPHLGHYYGDIFLVFKREVMFHPDANFSPQAATSFHSGRTYPHRPWVSDPGSESEKIKCFHRSKLHCSTPDYAYAAAAELIAITGILKKNMDVNVKDILHRWINVDSHEVFEAHLPQLVPLDYIDAVYIPKNLFESLSAVAQNSAKKTFRNCLHITDHQVNLAFSDLRSKDESRSKYQEFVVQKLIEKIEKRMKRSSYLYGTVITLAPSRFTEHVVLPVTVNKACDQYRRNHKRTTDLDDIYIYWQTMYGDMMLTLSNEPFDPKIKQTNIRYLVCYLAERPSITTTNYNEAYSYVNADDPFRHDIIMTNGNCSASTRTFYRGSNIENFLTFCLKLEKKTGRVTLSHAGPNGIYCNERISCHFPKATLDLSRLRFIHISAGARKIPVRNLIVTFEEIPDLHPSYDKNFTPEHNVSSRQKGSHSGDSSREKSPSVLSKVGRFAHNVVDYLVGNDKKRKPCSESIYCLSQKSPNHTEEFSHPCPYAEICKNQDQEPHLTHESRQVEQCSWDPKCSKLDDPIHRATYRHKGYPDFLIPCRNKSDCHDKTFEHRMKYSHGEKIDLTKNNKKSTDDKSSPSGASSINQNKISSYGGGGQENAQKIPCRYGSECTAQNDGHHCSKFSHPDGPSESYHDLLPCRYGNDCRNKNDPDHRAKFSHPNNRGSQASSTSTDEKIQCRHGRDCRDKNDSRHCLRYSHPSSSGHEKIQCQHGNGCRDKNDPQHCAKYSHPHGRGSHVSSAFNNAKIPCRHGRNCRDKDNRQHSIKFSH
ncbi:hypothetical protein I4U23_020114 [Adineta vaga]|nr:hypothetical protein I4U23_020114 [Adineta vaga]